MKISIVITIILWIFVIVISLINRVKKKQKEPSSSSVYTVPNELPPKIIYTFWDSDELPPIVKASIETWKKHCPEYEIRILNYENTKHIGIKHRDSHARYADFVRLYCLEETGGVWIDASVFLQRPLDDWIESGYDYTGYHAEFFSTDEKYPVIENWFMAAPKGSKFIADWKNEFFRANDFENMGDYVDDLVSRDINLHKIYIVNMHYFAQHVAAQYCVQKLGPYKLNLIKADDDALKYVMDSPLNWLWAPSTVNNLCENLKKYKGTSNMIKITGSQRKLIEERKDDCLSKLSV